MSERSSLVLVGGGARSGKSAFAVRRALVRGPRRVFVATAEALDDEMRARVAAHVEERGRAFATVEAPRDLDAALESLAARPEPPDVVVVDCLTLWLSNVLLAGATPPAIDARVDRIARTLASAPFPTLLVTNEVGFGVVPETALGRTFRDVAGRAHQRLARASGEIYLAALGCVLRIKPSPVAIADEDAT